jgi:hypothetical protein
VFHGFLRERRPKRHRAQLLAKHVRRSNETSQRRLAALGMACEVRDCTRLTFETRNVAATGPQPEVARSLEPNHILLENYRIATCW